MPPWVDNQQVAPTMTPALVDCQATSVCVVDPLMGVTEVAEYLGLSRQRIHQLVQRDPDFPAPMARLSAGLIWLTSDIEAWVLKTGRQL